MSVSTAAAAIATNVVTKASQSLFERIGKNLSKRVAQVRVHYTRAFEHHLDTTYNRCSRVKTLISKDEPIDLEEIYVSGGLSLGNKDISDINIIDSLINPNFLIVCGTAGAGKTMLMRYITCMCITRPIGRIPLFVELRNLPKQKELNLLEEIFKLVTPQKFSESDDLFHVGLQEGAFVLFLDGLDEVPPESRESVLSQIRDLPSQYPLLSVVISTRPESDIENMTPYSVARLKGLTKVQCAEVVRRTRYDETAKEKFISEIEDGLYERHHSFLSSPLLTVMMLLTYDRYADIPLRRTVFYGQAFDALFWMHDASKEIFKRQHFAKLPIDIFKKLFAAFCYRTIIRHEYEFDYNALMHHIERSAKYCSIDVDSGAFLNDLRESVCLIQRDGLKYVFTHRSFQEYFAAVFVVQYSGDNSSDVYNSLANFPIANNAMEIIYEIDSHAFEKFWALKAVDRYIESITKLDGSSDIHKIGTVVNSIRFDKKGIAIGMSWHRVDDILPKQEVLNRVYRKRIGFINHGIFYRVKLYKSPNKSLDDVRRKLGDNCPRQLEIVFSENKENYDLELNEKNLKWIELTQLPEKLALLVNRLNRLKKTIEKNLDGKSKAEKYLF